MLQVDAWTDDDVLFRRYVSEALTANDEKPLD
jgi:hypothetical protein